MVGTPVTLRSSRHRGRGGFPDLRRGTAPPVKLYELPRGEVFVRAAPEICFQVVSSAGRTLERNTDGTRLVEFEVTVGGKRIVTKELVRAREPERIDYRWVEGPLPAVEETIWIDARDGGAILRYEGRFGVDAPWFLRPFARRFIAKRFARAVHEHLLDAKELAERRANRSRLFPRKDRHESPETVTP